DLLVVQSKTRHWSGAPPAKVKPTTATSLLASENTHEVGPLLRVADRRAAHPGAGVQAFGIAEEKVEPVPRPHLALVARRAQHRRIVERRITRHRPADQAHELRAGLLAGVEAERVAGQAGFEGHEVAG